MEPIQVSYSLNQQNDGAIVDLWRGNQHLGNLSFDKAQLDAHIAAMGDLRASLGDIIPDPPARITADVNPRWFMPGFRKPEGRLLLLRHSGFGWLGFIFPDHEAGNVASVLTRSLPMATPSPQPPAGSDPSPHREAGPAHQGWSSPDGAWQGFGTGTGGGGNGGHL